MMSAIPAKPPTGNDGETVRAYYDHLYGTYLGRLHQMFRVDAGTFLLLGIFLVALIGTILVVALVQPGSTAAESPQPVETYDGYISEGNGPVGTPLILFFGGVVIWCVVLTAFALLHGQVY